MEKQNNLENKLIDFKEEKQEEKVPQGYNLFASCNENGYTFDAYLPNNDKVPNQFILKTYNTNKQVYTSNIEMLYRPIFGPDVGDVQSLENELDNLIKKLPKLK